MINIRSHSCFVTLQFHWIAQRSLQHLRHMSALQLLTHFFRLFCHANVVQSDIGWKNFKWRLGWLTKLLTNKLFVDIIDALCSFRLFQMFGFSFVLWALCSVSVLYLFETHSIVWPMTVCLICFFFLLLFRSY